MIFIMKMCRVRMDLTKIIYLFCTGGLCKVADIGIRIQGCEYRDADIGMRI